MTRTALVRLLPAVLLLSAALPAAGQTNFIDLTFMRMYDTDSVLPGLGVSPSSFSDPGVDAAGNTGSESSIAATDAITAVIDGTLRTISAGGVTVLPGTAEVIGNHDDYFMIVQGQTLFQAQNIGATSDRAWVLGNHLGLEVVVRDNDTQVPDQPGGTTFDFLPNTEDAGTDGTRVVFVGRFSGSTEQGVYLYESGTRSTIVDTGDSFGGMQFDSFRDATVGDGDVVFVGSRGGGAVTALFLYESGVLTELLNTNDLMPGGVSLITDIEEPDIDAGRIVVGLEGAGGERGYFLMDENGITTIVDFDTPLPDGSSATQIDLGRGSGIAGGFVGFVVQRGNGNEAFVWHGGHIERVLSAGDTLDGTTVSSVGTVNRPFVADGFMGLDVSFEDDSVAIYRVSLRPLSVSVPLMHTTPALILLLLVVGLFFLRRRQHRAHP